MANKPVAFRLSEEDLAQFDQYAESLGKNRTDAFRHVISQVTGIVDNTYSFLDSACPALIHSEDGFYCAAKVPKSRPWKIIEGTPSDAAKVCASCQALQGLKEKAELASKLEKGKYTVELPFCRKGGWLDESAKRLYCPDKGEYKLLKYCQNTRCHWFGSVTVDARLASNK